MVKAE